MDREQQTASSFKEKWSNNRSAFFAETMREGSEIFSWLLARNGFGSVSDFESFLGGKRRILDAGCGNGRVTALLRRYSDPQRTQIVGIDLVAAEIARQNLSGESAVSFHQRDLLEHVERAGPIPAGFEGEALLELLARTIDGTGVRARFGGRIRRGDRS